MRQARLITKRSNDWLSFMFEGTHGIVAVGTTGESATLSHSEDRDVIRATVDFVAGRIPVIAGLDQTLPQSLPPTEAATLAGLTPSYRYSTTTTTCRFAGSF